MGKQKAFEDGEEDEDVLLKTTFELNDTLFAEAELEETDTVHIWLGVSLKHLSLKHHLMVLFRPM